MASLALPARLSESLLSLQSPPRLSNSLGSGPVPQPGALGTQRPTPVTSTHPGLLRPGLRSAQPLGWERLLGPYPPPTVPTPFHTHLKCQPLGDAVGIFPGTGPPLLWGVVCLTDSPILETLPLRQGGLCSLPHLCLIQPRCPHRTLESRAEPGPWLPSAYPLALQWPVPTEGLWGPPVPGPGRSTGLWAGSRQSCLLVGPHHAVVLCDLGLG